MYNYMDIQTLDLQHLDLQYQIYKHLNLRHLNIQNSCWFAYCGFENAAGLLPPMTILVWECKKGTFTMDLYP